MIVRAPAAADDPAPATDRTDAELKARVHEELLARESATDTHGLRHEIAELLRRAAPLLPARRHEDLVTELVDEVSGLGPLEPLLADPEVTEIMVNGSGAAYVERAGRLEPVDAHFAGDDVLRLVERVVAPLGLRIDHASPMVEARLADGSRLHAVIPPLAVDGPSLTIRRFGARTLPLDAFGVRGEVEALLRWSVAAGWNLLVVGGTGAGKTTFLNSLSGAIGADERVVTIEETAELRLSVGHVVRLEARSPNAEGAGGVSVRALVRTALRMRPDRLVIGEVRGEEALDLLQALNTGHDGSMCTLHASDPVGALRRLETLALFAGVAAPLAAVRAQVLACIDAVVSVVRAPGGARRVERIDEVPRPADGAGLSTRRLAAHGPGGLVVAAPPSRRARRAGPGTSGAGAP